MLKEEKILFESGKLVLTEHEQLRNTTSFGCFSYKYVPIEEHKNQLKPLHSTLTNLHPLEQDLSVATFNNEYADVGKHFFESALLPGVQTPSPGYHSFKYLNVTEIEVDQVII